MERGNRDEHGEITNKRRTKERVCRGRRERGGIERGRMESRV